MPKQTMIEALRIIAAKSPAAAAEAIKTLKIPVKTRQIRYNFVADMAINDPEANFSAEERALIVKFIEPIDQAKSRMLPPIRVTEEEYAQIVDAAHLAGTTVSSYIRSRLFV